MSMKCPTCNGEKYLANNHIFLPCSKCSGTGKIKIKSGFEGQIYFYIDQNIISELRYNDNIVPEIDGIIKYIYSNQTLLEIVRARPQRHKEYLDVIRKIKAQKIVDRIDIYNENLQNYKASINGKIHLVYDYQDPKLFYESVREEQNYNSHKVETSWWLYYINSIRHVSRLLGIKENTDAIANPTIPDFVLSASIMVEKIRNVLGTKGGFANKYQNDDNPMHAMWEKIIRDKIPSNIRPTITEDTFYGFAQPSNDAQHYLLPHIILNIIGYNADSQAKIKENISNFIIDIKHIDMAARTDVFLSYDKKLSNRAAALYKWKADIMTVFLKKKSDQLNYLLYTHKQLHNHK